MSDVVTLLPLEHLRGKVQPSHSAVLRVTDGTTITAEFLKTNFTRPIIVETKVRI
jgi:hypothetical protein